MKFMVIVKATQDSEAGIIPSEELMRDMGNFNEALVKAGIMLSGDGLYPSSQGARVRFSGKNRTVVNGPF
ncbi:MAG: YciI family protein, partial [Pseudobdellovibrionaceae bacterium]|nr:YciI family protein [Pseudobdellovibrionaceae bacterium]